VRAPWWRVPIVRVPDLFLTYMDHDRPRLVTNAARVRHLNSLYGVALAPAARRLGRDLLPLASLNSATLLGAEMVGRSYGGGLLKLEPNEADRLPVPAPAVVRAAAAALRGIRREVDAALVRGELARAVELVDRVLLVEGLGLAPGSLDPLREARELLFARRAARSRPAR
jgi:hypothetical protein